MSAIESPVVAQQRKQQQSPWNDICWSNLCGNYDAVAENSEAAEIWNIGTSRSCLLRPQFVYKIPYNLSHDSCFFLCARVQIRREKSKQQQAMGFWFIFELRSTVGAGALKGMGQRVGAMNISCGLASLFLCGCCQAASKNEMSVVFFHYFCRFYFLLVYIYNKYILFFQAFFYMQSFKIFIYIAIFFNFHFHRP